MFAIHVHYSFGTGEPGLIHVSLAVAGKSWFQCTHSLLAVGVFDKVYEDLINPEHELEVR